MNTITIPLPVLTPEQLAEAFWALDDREQARFFGTLGACSLGTTNCFVKEPGSYFPLDFQMYNASVHCTPNGLRVMQMIGDNTSGTRLQPYLEGRQKMPDIPCKKGVIEEVKP
jgi:hypothetical protein